jgi:hypothetical protein
MIYQPCGTFQAHIHPLPWQVIFLCFKNFTLFLIYSYAKWLTVKKMYIFSLLHTILNGKKRVDCEERELAQMKKQHHRPLYHRPIKKQNMRRNLSGHEIK